MSLLCQGSTRPWESWGSLILTLHYGPWLLPHLQFADTPGNLHPSMNLSYLLGLRKNISLLLAYQ